jgi:glycyl-tRNA synthetase beta chain
LPQNKVGALLSVADKLDTIISFFGAQMIPSSSNDPYALRRAAYGIVRILLDQGWALDFKQELPALLQAVAGKTKATLPKGDKAIQQIASFIRDRVKQYLQAHDYQYDVIDAVLASSQQDPIQMLAAAKTLQTHHDSADFKPVVESLTRISSILAKGQKQAAANVDESLFDDETENELYLATQKLAALANSDMNGLYAGFVQLQPVIDAYFNTNMIMAKDQKVRANRLAQLTLINHLAERMGDLSKLVIK